MVKGSPSTHPAATTDRKAGYGSGQRCKNALLLRLKTGGGGVAVAAAPTPPPAAALAMAEAAVVKSLSMGPSRRAWLVVVSGWCWAREAAREAVAL